MNPWERKLSVHVFLRKEDEKLLMMRHELVDEWTKIYVSVSVSVMN